MDISDKSHKYLSAFTTCFEILVRTASKVRRIIGDLVQAIRIPRLSFFPYDT
jgi:hypothetical protein